MEALALTDNGGLSGAIVFHDAGRAAGVRPILGLELQVRPPAGLPPAPGGEGGRLTLLAMDLEGWGSLCRLSSALQAGAPAEGPAAALPFEALAGHTNGLLCLSGGRRSLAARLAGLHRDRTALLFLQRLHELFPDRLYVELQRQDATDDQWVLRLASLAGRLSLPLIATGDVYYLRPDQAGQQRLAAAIRLNRRLAELPEDLCASPGAHFNPAEEMERRFEDLPQAVENTAEAASRCHLELPLGLPNYPSLPLPAGKTPEDLLRQEVEAGAQRLYPEITLEIRARLEHELEVIGAQGYASLFLIMQDILRFARRQGIPFSSRGSAASSLAAHCLGITSPDPVRLNLYFERFLNPARATPPDIDTDLCSRRRDEVIEYVYERFGRERVAMVCTVNRFRRRSALRETAKAHGLPAGEVSKMVDSLPHRGLPWREGANAEPYAELSERFSTPALQAVLRDAAAIIGLPRHLSIHPGGVVIAPGPITGIAPTLLAAKGVVITQFDLESIERLGLVKIDLLGIRGLTVLGDVAEGMAPAEVPSSPAARLAATEDPPEDDPATVELVRSGRTIGCFQIESPGMRATLQEVQARCIDDVMVALALYRPGPLTGGLKDAFVRRHRGLEAPSQIHPALTPLLSDTYGVILYQEQVLRIAHELAGLSLADADLLRRAMSHFDPGKAMRTLQEKFVAGARQHSGVPAAAAGRVWELMAAFAGYGFPKAHAASYAQIAWRLAWCKAHHPALFMAAVLANWGGFYSQSVYLTEARRLGLALSPPHINYAGPEFSVRYVDGQATLFMGLGQVRELTHRTQRRILAGRPFRSLGDFLARADPRPVESENLIKAGALEGMGTIPALLRQLTAGSWRGGQLPLFDFDRGAGQSGEDWTLTEKVAAQEAVLGAGVSAHRLELAAEQIAAAGAVTTLEAAAQVGSQVRLVGMRQSWARGSSQHGEVVYSLSLEDLEGMLDVLISGEIYRRSRLALDGRGPYLVEGVVEMDTARGEPVIRAERIARLEQP